MSDNEDDPFALFGDDDENDDEDGEHMDLARSLVQKANQKDPASVADSSTTSNSKAAQGDSTASTIDFSALTLVDLPWKKPLYSGNIRLVSSLDVGGGRGYVATQTLAPGTLVLLEEPIVAWPEGEASSIDLERIQVILMSDKANQAVHFMESFHPTRSIAQDLPSNEPEQVEEMFQFYRDAIKDDDLRLRTILQVAKAKGVTNADGTTLEERDVLRLLVALRYNALETGVYLHIAMLNHADVPNCVKFKPQEGHKYSEVRTTKTVQPGEALTISYVPRFLCHASRRRHLWDQHRFDIGELSPEHDLLSIDLVGGKIPNATAVELMQNIEAAVAALEEQCRDLIEKANIIKTLSDDEAETAKALEQASLELYSSAQSQLANNHHILLLPCMGLHVDACDLVQRYVRLPKTQRARLLTRLVSTGRKLARVQREILGPDHFDLARTHLDVAQAIEGEFCSA